VGWLVWVWIGALALTCVQRSVLAWRVLGSLVVLVITPGVPIFFSGDSAPSVSSADVSSAFSAELEFDHAYANYATALREHVKPPRVEYARLKADRASLDGAVAALDSGPARGESSWTRDQRMAFWINAYNALTLQAIVNHYPIRGGWFSRGPSPSIRQIPGVWTTLKWPVAGKTVTLDDIEHKILRPQFAEPRIHSAQQLTFIEAEADSVIGLTRSGLPRRLLTSEHDRQAIQVSDHAAIDGLIKGEQSRLVREELADCDLLLAVLRELGPVLGDSFFVIEPAS
jgi:hypothetical protein